MHPTILTLALSIALPTSGVGAPPAHPQEPGTDGGPPNLLVLLADDLGVDAVGAYDEGLRIPATPNLDALAADGILFRNAWANAQCSPTRAALLTGRYGFRTGIGNLVEPGPPTGAALPLEEWTLPELLDLGTSWAYSHAAFGKWHLGNDAVGGDLAPNLAGFGHFDGSMGNLLSPFDYFNWPRVVDGVSQMSTTYATTATVDSTLAWIQATPEPWAAYVAFHAPHTPYHDPPASLHSVDLSGGGDRARFEAMVEAMDTEIGRLLDSLDPAVRSRTTVVFLGDNGTAGAVTLAPFDPNHAKLTLYEGGVNVPLIVAGASVPVSGVECDAPVEAVDLTATLLALAGADPRLLPDEALTDSSSLVALLSDPTAPGPSPFVYAETFLPTGPLARSAWALGPSPQCVDVVCQVDAGYGGPGGATLSACGPPLFGGFLDGDPVTQLVLEGAPPGASGSIYLSKGGVPTAVPGGMAASWPPFQAVPVVTDANGSFTMPLDPGPGVGWGFIHYQAGILHPDAPDGIVLSNAVAALPLGTDLEAIHDGRYKLIVDNKTCREVLHDLEQDPFEATDLFADGPLDPQALAAYQALRQALMDLRAAPPAATGPVF